MALATHYEDPSSPSRSGASTIMQEALKLRIYTEWHKQFDLARPIIALRSTDIMHTPALLLGLQRLFGADRVGVVVVMRHPLGDLKHAWMAVNGSWDRDCGVKELREWGVSHHTLFDVVDEVASSGSRVVVVQYESLVRDHAQGMIAFAS